MLTTDGHHLILGEIKDILTGEIIQDTHDERYRQAIATLLLQEKGYKKEDIKSNREIIVAADEKKAMIKIDFEVSPSGKIDMIIKYGPGSLTTRRRSALALSRLAGLRNIPFVVVTNGEDAEIVDGETGKIVGQGLMSIPSRDELAEKCRHKKYKALTEKQAEGEGRIAYAYEVDGACPCDETVCVMDQKS